METKLCISCNEVKPLSDFSPKKMDNQFKTSRQTHATYCRDCNARRSAEWRAQNKGYKPSGKVSAVPQEDRLLMSAIRQRLVDARQRCKKLRRSAPELTADYLYKLFKNQEGKCSLSGVPLSLEKDHPHTLSLDQIDSGKGYEEGNVQWLSWYINRAKGEMPTDVFLSMCETVLDYRKVQRLSNGSNS